VEHCTTHSKCGVLWFSSARVLHAGRR
jgi:hypothetical protein